MSIWFPKQHLQYHSPHFLISEFRAYDLKWPNSRPPHCNVMVYVHSLIPSILHRLHEGFCSSHFCRRLLHLAQPPRDRLCFDFIVGLSGASVGLWMPLSELVNTDTSGMCRFELDIELLACCCCIVIMYIMRWESGEVEMKLFSHISSSCQLWLSSSTAFLALVLSLLPAMHSEAKRGTKLEGWKALTRDGSGCMLISKK